MFKTPEARLPEKRATIDLREFGIEGGEIDVSIRMPLVLAEAAQQALASWDLVALRTLFLEWADARWNLTDHKGLLPVSEEGLGRLERAEQMAVYVAWLRGAVNLAGPLSRRSSNGARSGARSRRSSTTPKSTTSSSDATPATP